MKRASFGVLLALASFAGSPCSAQDASDVEVKPYGSYTASNIDTVDLASGNLLLDIPLVSYPQRGRLPALTFSVSLNNAPYTWNFVCDTEDRCYETPLRYDTTAPGSISEPGVNAGSLFDAKLGAYLNSSYEGGIVNGQKVFTTPPECSGTCGSGYVYAGQINYSMIDPGGATHKLNQESGNANVYHTADGTGYSFRPTVNGTNAYDAFNPDSGTTNSAYWLAEPNNSAVRAGDLYSPAGVRYTTVIAPEPSLGFSLLSTTVSDPFSTPSTDPSNKIQVTRSPWFWGTPQVVPSVSVTASMIAGFYGAPGSTNYPYFRDSIGRNIPDIISLQETVLNQLGSTTGCPSLTALNQPDPVISMPWSVPGPGGGNQTYLICYTKLNLTIDWAQSEPTAQAYVFDSIPGSGYAIQSVVLPDQSSYWGFAYDQHLSGTQCTTGGDIPHCGSGDLIELLFPTGANIQYHYTSIFPTSSVGLARCGGICRAVDSRTLNDGHGPSSTTTYSYATIADPTSTSPVSANAYTTIETSPPAIPALGSGPSVNSDTVHKFSELGSFSAPNPFNPYAPNYFSTSQLFETETDYFEGSASGSSPLKSVQTLYQFQWDIPPVYWANDAPSYGGYGSITRITNAVPTQIATVYQPTDVTSTSWPVDGEANWPAPASSSGWTTPTGWPYSSSIGATTLARRSYSVGQPLFTPTAVTCSGYSYGSEISDSCTNESWVLPLTTALSSYVPQISYVVPTQQDLYGSDTWLETTTSSFKFSSSSGSSYRSANLISLPDTEQRVNASGTIYSSTTYTYDETSTPTFGNLLSVSHWLSPTQSISTSMQYDSHNNPYKSIDPRGTITEVIAYQCAGLFPQSIVKAFSSTTTLPEETDYTYDCNTGAMTDVIDANGVGTHYTFTSDPLGRLTQVKHGIVGGTPTRTTTLSYPTLNEVDVASDQLRLGDQAIHTSTLFDGLGRTVTQTDPAGSTVETAYNPAGQVYRVTNPHNSDSAIDDGTTDGTTYFYYDPFGRKVQQVAQDSTTAAPIYRWWCYDGTADAVYPQPNCSSRRNTNAGGLFSIDSTDEAGLYHQEVRDGLDQLIAVVEPDPKSGTSWLETDYSYDGNGNLATVSQPGSSGEASRIRSFIYDPLSRLTSSTNPEWGTTTATNPNSGTTLYSYFNGTTLCAGDFSLPCTKTDARGVVTGYRYDDLNRLTGKGYTVTGTLAAPTPSTCYQYDAGAAIGFFIGRLSHEWTQTATCVPTLPSSGVKTRRSILAYDPMGRIKSELQCHFSTCSSGTPYTSTMDYDLVGHLAAYANTAQSVRLLNSFDPSGHLSTVSSSWADPTHPGLLFSGAYYTPAGGLLGATLGTNVKLTLTYDNRLRPTGETVTH